MNFERYFRSHLLREMPVVRRWSYVLCRNPSLAEDMMQETLVKAWANRGSFARGTNMRAWLYRILRNTYFNHLRQRRREVPDPDGALTAAMRVPAAQTGKIELREVTEAMQDLSPAQRDRRAGHVLQTGGATAAREYRHGEKPAGTGAAGRGPHDGL
jgi:RNA polymerase sigma-70 factor (ECF subfamily)